MWAKPALPARPAPVVPPPRNPEHGPVGCYLVYEPTSGGRLIVHYSRGEVPENAVGFWCPGEGQTIQGFKFSQNAGRQELIKGIAGGDSNRRKYFGGWCQFLKMGKAKKGKVIQFFPTQSVPVDVYAFIQARNAPQLLPLEDGLVDISEYDAIAVMPRHHEFMKGVKSIAVSNFLELGNLAGASTTMS
ncbi:predicted protein [Phaeodactylum tricornutum CCAP 1055/1]|jgi:hypothetical protein|uniref:Immune mapped protein 2 N-terminal domain-containing protein n=1 Tax=Phaeodactylum tricornutum (strain CCAP 1055/1) TaxID=556484 RepID=B7G9M0_PHATC|nr:predicted protein [Phaeodactylum tricornutum CCAP 1055/1]EEC44585.1 predicted protein [Phaeodactylum tricornutum CCAP 1055/1]|eukprot:XP_002183916.1 predicted protein [Phaeodactylum tricornutum CCAP 1055/1]